MKFAILTFVAVAAVSLTGCIVRSTRDDSANQLESSAKCTDRQIVIDAQVLLREVLESGDFGEYGRSEAFEVQAAQYIEVTVLDAHQGGFLSNPKPSLLLSAEGEAASRQTDARFPAIDDSGETVLEVDPGSYQLYTTANAVTVQVAVCNAGEREDS